MNGTSQNQSLAVRILLNQSSSSSSTVLKPQMFSVSSTKVSIIYDMLLGATTSYPATGTYSGTNGTLTFTLSVIPVGVRDPTFLWLPTNNSTLNNLPWGLKRYTGEQAFDLIEVDQRTGAPLSSYPVIYAQNPSDQSSFTLAAGLNNIIVPRSQFLDSVLGHAITLGTSTAWTNPNAKPPLLQSAENGTIDVYGSSNPLTDLACYWQNRAVNDNASGPSGAICSSEGGTAVTSTNSASVVAVTSASGINTGGLPSDPSLETSAESGAALQSVITLNITSETQLNLLLASLLDNTTGGVNGTLLNVTYEVPLLGFNPVVTNALANVTYSSGGLFGEPWGKVPPSTPPPCNSLWCWGSNLVSGIVTVAGHVYSFVWTISIAISQFIDDHLPTWLKNLGAKAVAATVTFLKSSGAFFWSEFTETLNFLRTEIVSLFTSAMAGWTAMRAEQQSIWNQLAALAARNFQNGGNITRASALALWNAVGGNVFLLGFAVAAVVTIALTVLLWSRAGH